MILGLWVYHRGGEIFLPSIVALAIVYLAIYLGTYWMVVEGLLVWRREKGVLEEPLPPLER
ncbi:MAG: hypothetical protein PVH19_00235 [Planctomycetia bacterium]